MSLRVVIELSGQPRGKARPRNNPSSTFPYIDPNARKYESQLRYAATQEMAGRSPTMQPVKMTVEQRFPLLKGFNKKELAAALSGQMWPTKKPDADNILKLADCLNKVVFIDDVQVVEASVRKIYSEHPGLTIIVETIEPPAAADPFAEAV
jgi:Holliday junction resolvase RusA-like endonuclease